MENKGAFAKKKKDKNSQRAFGYSKKDLDLLTKPIQDHNIIYKQIKDDCKVAMIIIKEKQGKAAADYIKRCNASKKLAKTI